MPSPVVHYNGSNSSSAQSEQCCASLHLLITSTWSQTTSSGRCNERGCRPVLMRLAYRVADHHAVVCQHGRACPIIKPRKASVFDRQWVAENTHHEMVPLSRCLPCTDVVFWSLCTWRLLMAPATTRGETSKSNTASSLHRPTSYQFAYRPTHLGLDCHTIL